MPRQTNKGLLGTLAILPWYCSVLTAVAIYVFTGHLLPKIIYEDTIFYRLADALTIAAPYIAAIFLLPLPVSLYNSWRKRRLLDQQKNIQSIKDLSWRQFEEMTAEVYRRLGYSVVENDSAGADGGIDLVIRKDGQKYLVQCKQWRNQKIGVSIVREMFGLITAEGEVGGIVITAGEFTQPSYDFAKEKPLELIAGKQLIVLCRGTQKDGDYVPEELYGDSELPCPDCGATMYLRTAGQGPMTGNKFWGCSKFPGCHGTRDYINN